MTEKWIEELVFHIHNLDEKHSNNSGYSNWYCVTQVTNQELI